MLVQVRQNTVQLSVPAWMLDSAFCAQLDYESEPRLALSALIERRELLDAQSLLASLVKRDQHRRNVAKSGR